MRIRLLRKHENGFGKYYIGHILNLTNSYAFKLIKEGIAERYTGEYPPKSKMKTDFFKPKIQWQ